MAKPTSKTAIANLALGHLKIDPVVSIDPPDEESKAARAANKWYDQARRATLEDHPWKFASKRVEILAESDEPEFEYTKKYELPDDYIRVNRLGENWDDPEQDYEIEDGYILCDIESPLKLVYVYDLKNVSKFSPKFVSTLAYKLASFMAYEMTGNREMTITMNELYTAELTTAASVSGQNRPTRRVQRSRLAEARMNIGRNRNWRSWGDS